MLRYRQTAVWALSLLTLALLLFGLHEWRGQVALIQQREEGALLRKALLRKAQGGPRKQAQVARPAVLTNPVIADHLPPTTTGPALGVCDPVVQNASPDTATFGAGCTRWLQFSLMNYPQLSQMPPCSFQLRARQELGTPNLRLTAPQAARFARMMGYTHVAVSTITGTPAHCTLVVTVLAMPGKVTTGQPCSISGSEAQVIAALPDLAQQLLTHVNVQVAPLPAPTLTAADLRCIGGYDWWPEGMVSAEEQQQMQALAPRHPLAGLLYLLHTPLPTHQMGEDAYRRVLTQAPTNVEPRAECLTIWPYLTPSLQEDVARGLPADPNNSTVATWQYLNKSTGQEAIRRAEHLVQCAPRNPSAWLTLAHHYESVAGQMREARAASDLTPAEWNVLARLYAHQLTAAQHAAALDPDLGQAWYAVAGAATFASAPSVADAALWKAIRLDKGNARAYLWGLEMYQPKWFDDAAKLDKVVQLAIADHSLSTNDRYKLAAAVQELGRSTDAQALKAGSQAQH